MKVSRVILPIILIAALGVSWTVFVTGTSDTYVSYHNNIKEAEKSEEAGLYEQAVEYYEQALEYKCAESIYERIKEIDDLLYEEEHTAFVRELYLEDMSAASENFPQNALFWEKQIELYMDAENYSKAYTTAKKALNYGADSDELDSLYTSLLYMVKTDYKLYYDYKTALNGYISVYDGSKWTVIDENGENIAGEYKLIGVLNDEGKGLYINDIDTRILDAEEITRARFDFEVEDAGYYSEESDLIPVKIDERWKYMNSQGEFIPGEYEIAGSFYNRKAAAFTGEKWVLIDEKGNQMKLNKEFEDIKLDLYGCYIQCGVVIAKENGMYHFYDTDFNKISDFEAEDMDICIGDSLIAFEKDGKWGFVDKEGNVKVEPKFADARSFANGYAAVGNEEGLWGFINDKYQLIIDYTYIDALYFNSQETCLVSTTENTVQLLKFMFE